MTCEHTDLSIDDYLRERLMPVEGSIPQISGIEMYGNSVPVETVGGDLFEYINFQQRYHIDTRIQQAARNMASRTWGKYSCQAMDFSTGDQDLQFNRLDQPTAS